MRLKKIYEQLQHANWAVIKSDYHIFLERMADDEYWKREMRLICKYLEDNNIPYLARTIRKFRKPFYRIYVKNYKSKKDEA
jgi:hypothetical protein